MSVGYFHTWILSTDRIIDIISTPGWIININNIMMDINVNTVLIIQNTNQ